MLFHTIRLAKMKSLTGPSFVRVWSDRTSYLLLLEIVNSKVEDNVYTIAQKYTARYIS